jgi:hypothetical protein
MTNLNELPKVEMRLVGQDGNAFSIMGRFQGQARKAGWTKEQIQQAISEMTSGDYDNLLRTVMKYTVDEEDF